MVPRTVIVFGGSGWTGRVLASRLEARGYEFAAPSHADLDLAEPAVVRAYLRVAQPDVILNLSAAQPGADEATLEAVNVLGAEAVAQGAAEGGSRLVHVSSDAVLDGRGSPYADDAPTSPLGAYGVSKAEGEARVLAAHPSALVVRTSLLWDPDAIDRGTAGFEARLAAGEPCRLFTDEIRCPIPRTALAEALVDLIEIPWSGTLNVAGREAVSRHDFAMLLLRHFGVPGLEAVEAVRSADLTAAGAPPRALDVRLDVRRAESLLGRSLPGLRELLG
jgi:dTDP-4-dehydrorhamnose reductase